MLGLETDYLVPQLRMELVSEWGYSGEALASSNVGLRRGIV